MASLCTNDRQCGQSRVGRVGDACPAAPGGEQRAERGRRDPLPGREHGHPRRVRRHQLGADPPDRLVRRHALGRREEGLPRIDSTCSGSTPRPRRAPPAGPARGAARPAAASASAKASTARSSSAIVTTATIVSRSASSTGNPAAEQPLLDRDARGARARQQHHELGRLDRGPVGERPPQHREPRHGRELLPGPRDAAHQPVGQFGPGALQQRAGGVDAREDGPRRARRVRRLERPLEPRGVEQTRPGQDDRRPGTRPAGSCGR